jgi:hypothetical protein
MTDDALEIHLMEHVNSVILAKVIDFFHHYEEEPMTEIEEVTTTHT